MNAQTQPVFDGSMLELNKGDNFIFAIDVSGSMGATDCPGGMKRIDYLKEKVKQFAGEASKYDEDGIDVLTFGHQVKSYKGVTADKANEIISPLQANEGSTDTAGVIKAAWDLHKAGGYKQTVLFVATDGEPNDRSAVAKTIVDITNQVSSDGEFSISFLTVGQIDAGLKAFLNSLDDDLQAQGAKYDIVDVKELESVDFIGAFMGALND